MKIWPWLAGFVFVVLAVQLKAWRSSRDFAFLSRAWLAWGLVCGFAAFASLSLLSALPLDPTLWLARWRGIHWQLDFWVLATGPALIAICRDLKAEHGNYEASRGALAYGFALAPLLAGAFPWRQVAALLWPFLLLLAALKILRRQQQGTFRQVWSLASLNALGFLHGLLSLPGWLGSLLLAAALAFGLNPGPFRSGAAAWALGCLGIAAKIIFGWPDSLASTFLICAFILCGWLLPFPKYGNHAATS